MPTTKARPVVVVLRQDVALRGEARNLLCRLKVRRAPHLPQMVN
jgi:hypothetical protein